MPIIDVKQAAHDLRVSERTVRRLVATRAIGCRRVAGLVRFTERDLTDYVKSVLVSAEA